MHREFLCSFEIILPFKHSVVCMSYPVKKRCILPDVKRSVVSVLQIEILGLHIFDSVSLNVSSLQLSTLLLSPPLSY